MGNNATSQQSLHTNSIKNKILSYLEPSSTESLGYKIAINLQKADRGLNSHATARFLIPHQHLQAFEMDPDRYSRSYHPLCQLAHCSSASSPCSVMTIVSLQKSGPHSCMMNIPGGMRRTGSGDYFMDMFWHG